MAFLLPNMIGVLTFVILPVVFSVVLAFTNWDLRRHNMFKEEPLKFVGLDNFIRLVTEGDFFRFLGNTLFLMMAIPFSVGGALLAAILLSKNSRGGGGKVFLWLLLSAVFVGSIAMLTVLGLGSTGMVILLTGVGCGIVLMGVGGGTTVYRTLFYTPHFTAGVATFLLWKKLYNPQEGPVNQALQPALDGLAAGVNATGQAVTVLSWVCLAGAVGMLALGWSKLRRMWADGELGVRAAVIPTLLLLVPGAVVSTWWWGRGAGAGRDDLIILASCLLGGVALAAIWQLVRIIRAGKDFKAPNAMEGVGGALMLSLGVLVVQFVLLGLATVFESLPRMAADGLGAPQWISSYDWAKPSLMIMALWGSIGSNNMLLYLAGLSNVPQDLYDAADIDGASRLQRFWHVTWPQLAPTTFFIVVMSTIAGLKGGFEMARTMTQGGPAGATTTMSYFIYLEGFQTGRLSSASAVAWALFILILVLTLFNWRFGNKYVNE